MLIQATTPRPVLDHSRHPEYVYLHTLAKTGVSEGQVLFTGTTNPEHGQSSTRTLEPYSQVPIDGEEGFMVQVYVLPFWELFQGSGTAKYDGGIVRSAPIALVRLCTAGFKVTAHSAYRTGPRSYEARTLAFTIMTAATGGGILRFADSPFDVSNPNFDPWHPNPEALTQGAQDELGSIYNRTHRLSRGAGSKLRDQRVAEAEASMKGEHPSLPEGERKALIERT